MLNQTDEYLKMSEVESTHWWYHTLHQMVYDGIKKHFNTSDPLIVDAGCGTGGLMKFLKDRGLNRISGFDISETAVNICRSKALPATHGDIKNIGSLLSEKAADVIILNDVLYFFSVTEQRTITDEIYKILNVGGLLIVNMPAMRMFRGRHDLKVGITARFEIQNLPLCFNTSNYKLVHRRYWPFLLSPFIFLRRTLQRVNMRLGGITEARSDLQVEPKWINALCFATTRIERYLYWNPAGSSLFLLFKKEYSK